VVMNMVWYRGRGGREYGMGAGSWWSRIWHGSGGMGVGYMEMTVPYSRSPRPHYHTIFTNTTTPLPYHILDHPAPTTIAYSPPPPPRYHSIFTAAPPPLPYHIHGRHDLATIPYSRPPRHRYHTIFTIWYGSGVVVVVNMVW
jgi:hypothetical protein